MDKLKTLRVDLESALRDGDAAKRNTASAWQIYQRALHNLRFVRNDGTHGVHNNDFALALLASVEEDFKQVRKQLDTIW